jgi:hypothetical protein
VLLCKLNSHSIMIAGVEESFELALVRPMISLKIFCVTVFEALFRRICSWFRRILGFWSASSHNNSEKLWSISHFFPMSADLTDAFYSRCNSYSIIFCLSIFTIGSLFLHFGGLTIFLYSASISRDTFVGISFVFKNKRILSSSKSLYKMANASLMSF